LPRKISKLISAKVTTEAIKTTAAKFTVFQNINVMPCRQYIFQTVNISGAAEGNFLLGEVDIGDTTI
jgi:hypothetical protein